MRASLLILLILVGWLQPAGAEEPHTFWGKTIEGWIAVFRDKASTEVQRQQAVVAIGCFGAEAKAAVPDLIEVVRKGQFQDEAVQALVQIGSGAEVTVPILIQRFLMLRRPRAGMGAIGVPLYVEDSLVRIGGPAVPALRDILNDSDQDMRVHAARALARIGPAARAALPSLIRAIVHRNPKTESEILIHYAALALGRIVPEAKAAVPVLNGLLVEKGEYDFDVVLALDRIGASPVRKLRDDFLRESDPYVAEQLAWLGPKAREAIPVLRAALRDKRPRLRFSAAVALTHIDPSVSESIPVLIEALNHRDDRDLEIESVSQALARLGPRARTALPTVIDLVKKGSDDADLLKALIQIDPEGTQCVPALIAALKNEDLEVANTAANCLGFLGPRAKDAVSALALVAPHDFQVEVFRDGGNPQASAAKALRRIGPKAKPAIPALIGALTYRHDVADLVPDYSAALAAVQALGSFGGEAKAAIPALIETVRAREKYGAYRFVRKTAILALGQIQPDAKASIPVLKGLMKEYGERSDYHPELVMALYQLAPDGKDIAERWLEKPMSNWVSPRVRLELEGRAMVLGAMGRASFETDWLTRSYLQEIELRFGYDDPRDENRIGLLERWFERLGRLGSAARLAFPRLNEFRKNHPNPWVRMWAAEALERIAPHTPARTN